MDNMGNMDNMEETLGRLLERLLRPIAEAPNLNARLLAPLARRIRSAARSRRTRRRPMRSLGRHSRHSLRMVGARHRSLRGLAPAPIHPRPSVSLASALWGGAKLACPTGPENGAGGGSTSYTMVGRDGNHSPIGATSAQAKAQAQQAVLDLRLAGGWMWAQT
jgi:hypothetical protein